MKSGAVLLILMTSTGLALADWGPDPEYSSAWMEYSGPETVSLFVLPDGSGSEFAHAMVPYGVSVDATVYCQLMDYGGFPIQGFPGEDMWLESVDDGLVFCAQGTSADTDTDANGIATWSTPLHAGGHSEGHCNVMVNGSALFTPLNLQFNSADISGDLVVNLTDVSLFAENLFGIYNYRCDFYFDGVINIADLAKLAEGISAACP